ncbi:MAG: hypothetical protein WAM30_12220 [Candidatus Dormiibacterota bacterium]
MRTVKTWRSRIEMTDLTQLQGEELSEVLGRAGGQVRLFSIGEVGPSYYLECEAREESDAAAAMESVLTGAKAECPWASNGRLGEMEGGT